MKVDFIIKNKVSEQDFEETIYEWLSQGDYTPDDIIENIITEHNLMYFPVHYYKSSYVGTATASLGYDRREYYSVWNDTTKKHERKSRIVTDWKPHSQNAMGNVSATIYAGEAKFKFISSFIEGTGWSGNDLIRLEEDTSRNQKFLTMFKRDMNDAWKNTALQESHNKASREIINGFPSSQVRNFNANLQFKVTDYASIVLPYWVFMYDYEGKPYYVAVDGNSPSRVSGIRPENKKRKNQVRAVRWIGWLSAIGLTYLGATTYYEANPYEDLKALGLGLLIFICLGFVTEGIVSSIKNASKKRRQEKLNNRKAKKEEKKEEVVTEENNVEEEGEFYVLSDTHDELDETEEYSDGKDLGEDWKHDRTGEEFLLVLEDGLSETLKNQEIIMQGAFSAIIRHLHEFKTLPSENGAFNGFHVMIDEASNSIDGKFEILETREPHDWETDLDTMIKVRWTPE
jgi:hypothetical protein